MPIRMADFKTEWTDVSSDFTDADDNTDSTSTTGKEKIPLPEFLETKGLGRYAESLIRASDAECVNDLKLLDTSMVDALVAECGLKLVSAEKLRRVITELRSAESNEVTCEAKETAQTDAVTPINSMNSEGKTKAEHIVVAIDRSGSMGTPFHEVTLNVVEKALQQRTRMDAVKCMFYAFRDRVEGVGGIELGLVAYDNRVERMLDITPELDQFESVVDDMKKRGSTAIFSAVVEAVSMLEMRQKMMQSLDHKNNKNPCAMRVLCLTDGQNNTGVTAQTALDHCLRVGVVVDAIIVGDTPDPSLLKVATATGGDCFQINSLGDGFELLENDAVASLWARHDGLAMPQRRPSSAPRVLLSDVNATVPSKVGGGGKGGGPLRTAMKKSVLPPRKVTELSSFTSSTAATDGSVTSGTMKRLAKELRDAAQGKPDVWLGSGEGVHIFPVETDIREWRAVIEGPPGSPFEGGNFALRIVAPNNYPFSGPKITFITPVYHCNVSDSGGICIEELLSRWSPNLTIPRAIEMVRALLREPDTDNALRQWIAELVIANRKHQDADTRYVDEAKVHTATHASSSIEELVQSWSH